VRNLGRNVVIEKEPHAAKRFSNSTLGTERRVVLDPNRQFGQPIVFKSGVRTEILYLAVKNGASEDEVAEWFEVERKDVQDAE